MQVALVIIFVFRLQTKFPGIDFDFLVGILFQLILFIVLISRRVESQTSRLREERERERRKKMR